MTMCNCIECVGYQREPTDQELAAYEAEMVAADAAYKKPPCPTDYSVMQERLKQERNICVEACKATEPVVGADLLSWNSAVNACVAAILNLT